MEPITYLRALRRYWPMIAAAVAVGLLTASLTRAIDPGGAERSFEATTYLISSSDTGQSFSQSGSFDDANTVAALTTLDPIPSRVADQIGYDGKPADLAVKITAAVDEESGLLSITATDPDPKRVKQIADAFASELLAFLTQQETEETAAEVASLEAQIKGIKKRIRHPGESDTRGLETRLALLQGDVDNLTSSPPEPGFEVLSGAEVSPVESLGIQAPRSFAIRALLAALIGLVAGVIMALVLGRFDTRIRTRQGAEEGFSLPVLAEIPVLPRGGRDGVIAASQPSSRAAEAFRLLGAEVGRGVNLDGDARAQGVEAGTPRPPHTVLVTSGGPAEGKTTVVANLAATLAETGKKVLILSCDFHRPSIHRLFGVANDKGLADALRSSNNGPVLGPVIRQTLVDDIRLVPSGPLPNSPGELLSSEHMRDVLEEARELADVVLLDTPPILVASDATHLLPEVDGVLVVARAGRTKAEIAKRTSELILRMGARVQGVVLNRAMDVPLPRGYRDYYRARPVSASVGDFPNLRGTEPSNIL
ncbi:MAG: polysaccharide biosynthesis tyrosine autokinase [Actinomycetota bacterium]